MSPGAPHMGYSYLILLVPSASSRKGVREKSRKCHNIKPQPFPDTSSDFNCRNKALTAKFLMQGYCHFKLRKSFSKFYRRHSALVENMSVWKHFCNNVYRNQNFTVTVYRFRKNVGKSNFSRQLRKLINRYKIDYSLEIMLQTACLITNTSIVDGYASPFNCTTAVRASDSMTASSRKLNQLGLDDMSLAWSAVVQLLVFIYSGTQ